ncbi:neural cell adhesion molecule 2 [Nasonia vitripennis]|uniref:Ig-like domain-containing protein n=1 Tax=Nasonia vitripennis TaxID=7425 RepID=A0A7M7Q076_NASVI|nr:neural cell adhesion molecule 2 [Nasonia vitripennis]XP_031779741.1 neural cell adhesion molecule 2 [Nasonia vitripennis]XP_031779749.1 neural cell adhesion molecule 2 [Nasonia vitripennis]XP_031779751.1 neural cell adhesion molecule 2 [Nasonia vitripennis]XP_031779753.1 neural cell adhesion molecule 2 [Nasonia vitripennis]XP_032451719.1 neural cell adhesion molecule 2 [Nasonia vitripennis]XP_032451720.1 neural cell adhesion molecule 2 [Nasonia vitripennis]XP_032451721.1 neural cell adhes
MRFILILATLILEVQLYFTGSHAKQNSNGNSVVTVDEKGFREQDIPGMVKDAQAQRGGTATLPCKLIDNGAGIVTWVRRKDRQLLTVGQNTHSVDKRFMVKHVNNEWSLLIQKVTCEDAGLYECQVASHPVQQYFVRLSVTEAYSVIPGAPDLHVKQGSNLRLECQLMSATEAPLYVFWYRNARMINYDSEPGVRVELTKAGSVLEVEKTQLSHGGNYTCAPSNAKEAYVMVHVLEEEEKPAAMHGGDRRNLSPAILASNFLVSLLAAVSWRIPSFTSLYPT